jgi:glycosyltransferase involved in cell wall biosynthesis
MNEPLFTIIIDAYYKPHFVKQAVEGTFRQTYSNLEIILINNGATPETLEYLYEVEKVDTRVKLIHFKENQFSFDDPVKMIEVCLNAGLHAATGEYVLYHSYDDIMADDYVEKMVKLFLENPDCTTAAGIYASIDADSKIMEDELSPRSYNYRPRYMPGHILALAHARGEKSLFGAPLTIFTLRRDELIKEGGFHHSIENSHIFGIIPFGITGFDESAVFYNRRHEGQLNRVLDKNGYLLLYAHDLIKDWDIHGKWQRKFRKRDADMVVAFLKREPIKAMALWFSINLFSLRFVATTRIFVKACGFPLFWKLLPLHLWQQKFLLSFLPKRFLRMVIRLGLKIIPGLAKLPRLKQLNERVNRFS